MFDCFRAQEKEDVMTVLLTPMEVIGKSADNTDEGVQIVGGPCGIETTQTYYSALDCDMSDFACGFYEIIYRDFLKGNSIVSQDGTLWKQSFAGDTMNSASRMVGLKGTYHCLANFWLLPMYIGRTSPSTPFEYLDFSKSHVKRNDYMDLFLLDLKHRFLEYQEKFPDYFEEMGIDSFEKFSQVHFLGGSYLGCDSSIVSFSGLKNREEKARGMMRDRAEVLACSPYGANLYQYFKKYHLLPESSSGYDCPRCGRSFANSEQYAVPPFCEDCGDFD